jgi:hypothetical protein
MTFVRAYFHSGMTTPKPAANTAAGSIPALLSQPYLGRGAVDGIEGGPQTIGPAPRGTSVVLVQIASGRSAHIEVNAPHRAAVSADDKSPLYSGDVLLDCAADWCLSIIEGPGV